LANTGTSQPRKGNDRPNTTTIKKPFSLVGGSEYPIRRANTLDPNKLIHGDSREFGFKFIEGRPYVIERVDVILAKVELQKYKENQVKFTLNEALDDVRHILTETDDLEIFDEASDSYVGKLEKMRKMSYHPSDWERVEEKITFDAVTKIWSKGIDIYKNINKALYCQCIDAIEAGDFKKNHKMTFNEGVNYNDVVQKSLKFMHLMNCFISSKCYYQNQEQQSDIILYRGINSS
jgi:hypothetical protein